MDVFVQKHEMKCYVLKKVCGVSSAIYDTKKKKKKRIKLKLNYIRVLMIQTEV